MNFRLLFLILLGHQLINETLKKTSRIEAHGFSFLYHQNEETENGLIQKVKRKENQEIKGSDCKGIVENMS